MPPKPTTRAETLRLRAAQDERNAKTAEETYDNAPPTWEDVYSASENHAFALVVRILQHVRHRQSTDNRRLVLWFYLFMLAYTYVLLYALRVY